MSVELIGAPGQQQDQPPGQPSNQPDGTGALPPAASPTGAGPPAARPTGIGPSGAGPPGARPTAANLPGAGPPTHKTRHALIIGLRLVISAVLLGVVFTRVSTSDFEDIWPDSIGTAAGWLLAAGIVTALAFVMAAVRWWEAAHTLGLTCSFRIMLGDHLAGQFVSNFLPTTIGGDVLRINRLGRATGDHYRTFASVVIERLTGWFVLPAMTLVALAIDALALNSVLFDDSTGWLLFGVATAILLIFAGLLWGAEHPRGLGRLAGGTVIRDALGSIHVGLSLYRRRPRAAWRLFLAGLLYQALLVVAAILAAASIGVRPGVAAMFAFIPIVLITQVLPISIGGLGVREAVLVFLLSSQGVPDAEAILLGLLLYALTLIVSLAGAPSLALGGRHKHRHKHRLKDKSKHK